MTFEAVLQILKKIASNSNYKTVCKRMARIWAIRFALMLNDNKLSTVTGINLSYTGQSITVVRDADGQLNTTGDNDRRTVREMDAFGRQVLLSHALHATHYALQACTLSIRLCVTFR